MADLGRIVIIPKGDYSNITTYEKLDIVRYDNKSWLCKVNGTVGITPTEGDNWSLVVADGYQGSDGRGVANVSESTSGKVHTFTMTFSDGSTPFVWTVSDGADGSGGGGDMFKSTYDTDDDGVVDKAEKVGNANTTVLEKLGESSGKLTYGGEEIGGTVKIDNSTIVKNAYNELEIPIDKTTLEVDATSKKMQISSTIIGKVSKLKSDGTIDYANVNNQPTIPTVTDTYSSTSTNAMSGKAVASAIGELDVASVGGAGNYISAISETDGKISATATPFPVIPTVTDTYSATSNSAMSGIAVASAIGDLDVSSVGGTGKVITQISETDGKISATASDLSALVDGTNVVVSSNKIGLSSGITTKLSKLDTDTTATNGQALAWNGTTYTPTTIQGGISPSSILSTVSAVENNTTSGKVVDALVIKDYSNRHTNSVISTLTANNNEITITNDVFKDDNATFEFMFEPTLNASSEYEYLTLSGYTLNTTTGVLVLTVSNAPTVNTRVRVDVSTYRA